MTNVAPVQRFLHDQMAYNLNVHTTFGNAFGPLVTVQQGVLQVWASALGHCVVLGNLSVMSCRMA